MTHHYQVAESSHQRFETWTDMHGTPAVAGWADDHKQLADSLIQHPEVTRVWTLDRWNQMRCVYALRKKQPALPLSGGL